MEALRPFYSSQFSFALSPSGAALQCRGTVQVAAGFPSQRYPCLQPMKCVLDEKKDWRPLQFNETDDRGKLLENEAVEHIKKEGPLYLNE